MRTCHVHVFINQYKKQTLKVLMHVMASVIRRSHSSFCFSVPVIFQVYRSDHTYSKLRLRRDTTVRNIIKQCCEKWRIDDECVLCELKSNGGKNVCHVSY